MDLKNRLTKTPYLVLFIVLISIGVGTASALITITLSGNVLITGDTELEGKLLDVNDDAGTSGQVLSSTVTGIDWVDAIKLYYLEESFTTSSAFPSKLVLCDPGDIVTGGGSSTNKDLTLLNDFPSAGAGSPGPGILNGWVNRYSNPGLLSVTVTAYAICADFDPPHVP